MTELMKRYEAETDECATYPWHNKEFVTDDYIAWLESQLIEFEGGRITHETYEKLVSITEECLKPLDELVPRVVQRIDLLEMQLEEAQAKAEAYDRLMSGGKKTLKEWANLFGMVVAVDQNGEAACFVHIPVMFLDYDEGIWTNNPEHYGEETYLLPPHLIDFDGDWKDSLTLPDGWEEK